MRTINISFTEIPLLDKDGNYLDIKLRDNMHFTKYNWKNKSIPWNNLHRMVSSDYRQYSSFKFKDGIKVAENCILDDVSFLCLDIDDGLTIEEAKKRFSKYNYFLCTTKSHQKEKKGHICDRFRIILTITNMPDNDSYFDYMRNLEKLYPFIDKQVNTKTGAFLGSAKCEYFYNDGIDFDMNILKPINLLSTPKELPKIKNENFSDSEIEVEQLKQLLTQEAIGHILTANGFDVDRNFKLKLREERTPSSSISREGLIKDFGTDFASDVFGVLMEYRGMTFPQAIEEVRKFAWA